MSFKSFRQNVRSEAFTVDGNPMRIALILFVAFALACADEPPRAMSQPAAAVSLRPKAPQVSLYNDPWHLAVHVGERVEPADSGVIWALEPNARWNAPCSFSQTPIGEVVSLSAGVRAHDWTDYCMATLDARGVLAIDGNFERVVSESMLREVPVGIVGGILVTQPTPDTFTGHDARGNIVWQREFKGVEWAIWDDSGALRIQRVWSEGGQLKVEKLAIDARDGQTVATRKMESNLLALLNDPHAFVERAVTGSKEPVVIHAHDHRVTLDGSHFYLNVSVETDVVEAWRDVVNPGKVQYPNIMGEVQGEHVIVGRNVRTHVDGAVHMNMTVYDLARGTVRAHFDLRPAHI